MRRGSVLPIAAALALHLAAAAARAGEPPLRVETLAGEPVLLRPTPGEKALLIHFWATWCPECVAELPLLESAVPRCAPSGVRIVTVDVGDDRETLTRYLEQHGLALPVLRDPDGDAWRRIGGFGLPSNLTWTGQGRRLETGPRDTKAWEAALRALGCP